MLRHHHPHSHRTQGVTQPRTQGHKRTLPAIFGSNGRLEERFWRMLDESDPRDTVYVYRAEGGRAVPPYLFRSHLFADLIEHLRTRYGSGEYALYIRRGDKMRLAGRIAIEAPRNTLSGGR